MSHVSEALEFPCGRQARNRWMLAPMTNCQSLDNGAPSPADFHWLEMRAQGGFGMVLSAAAYINPRGKGFPGQLGIDSDALVPELSRLVQTLKQHDSLALVQLYHAGLRALPEAGDQLLAPSDDETTGARALTNTEVYACIEEFIAGAERAQRAGFDGVELHAAHTYLLHEFISSDFNRREDEFGGSAENRCRALISILQGVRQRCGADFIVGVRLSPEALMISQDEAMDAYRRIIASETVDFIDLSMWDVRKQPAEEAYVGRALLDYYAEIPRGAVKLGVAGKLYSAADAAWALDNGADFVLPGRGAILHHDFPLRAENDPEFSSIALPVSAQYLRREGLGEAFIRYIEGQWPDFIAG
ncbi:NADH:flavin oxidoreductase [Haliea sp. E17]|uniref:NADH:flavin oxidoreductase n=1 Tax=Haliea sp. E17 TaxID=3401576 RepID=UPI003AAA6576